MQVRRFDLTAVDYSKMRKKKNTIEGKISYFDSDANETTKIKSKDNEGLLRTPVTSDTDLRNIVVVTTEDTEEIIVVDDSEWIHIHDLGFRFKKQHLDKALGEYYNAKVEFKRHCFHQGMSEIERKINDVLCAVQTMDAKYVPVTTLPLDLNHSLLRFMTVKKVILQLIQAIAYHILPFKQMLCRIYEFYR